MIVDSNERLACLEARMREVEGLIRECKTDARVLAVGLVLVFVVFSRFGQAVLASLEGG